MKVSGENHVPSRSHESKLKRREGEFHRRRVYHTPNMAPIPAESRPRSLSRRRHETAALFAAFLIVATACASSSAALRERTFATGERRHSWGPTSLELQHAHYGPQVVRVRVLMRNDGDAPVHVRRDGILLAYDGLEYPLADVTMLALDEVMALLPHSESQLELAFRLARPMTREGKLVLRGMTRDAQSLTPLVLAIPAVLDEASVPPSRDD